MSLIDKLTDTEKRMMESYIDRYAMDDTYRTASIEYLLRFWDKNKSEYLDRLFEGNLTISKMVTFKQDVEETADEIRRIVMHDKVANKFLMEWRNTFGWYDCPGADLPEEVRYNCYDMPNWENLANHTWNKDSFIIPFPDGTSFKVQRGAKISKAMRKIAKGFNLSEEGYEAFRIACSLGLNQKTVTGKLVLSIHPLDYMTMSDNENDWSSCMSWREGGCYRQGTVEMMNSHMVVVAYLDSEDEKLHWGGQYEWNSKKWRELMIVTPDIICNVLGYPYRNSNLSQMAITMLKELAEKNLYWKYKNETPIVWQQNKRFYPFGKEIGEYGEETGQSVYIETDTYRMYNDFSDRDHYGYFSEDVDGHMCLYYSGPSECMCCGREDPDIDEEGCLVGYCCQEVEYCDCCGERIYRNDESGWVDDLHLCSYCMDERCSEDIHGDYHYEDNLKEVILMSKENKAKYDSVRFFYDDWNGDTLKRYFTKLYSVKVGYWGQFEKYYVHVSDLTEEGLKLFYYETGCKSPEELEEIFHSKWARSYDKIKLEGSKICIPGETEIWW